MGQQQSLFGDAYGPAEKKTPVWFPEIFEAIFHEPENYLYTPDQIAHRVKRTPQTIYNALGCFNLEGMKVGKNKGTWLVPKKAVRMWLLGGVNFNN
jgi:hypothetical protein